MNWIVAGLAVWLSGFLYAVIFGAPWLPTRQKAINQIFNELGVIRGQTFVDLGCGSGGVLVAAAKRGAKPVGYEINPLLWLVSWLRLRPYKGKIYCRSYWRANLGTADIVFVFLIAHFMPKLQQKVQAELKRGAVLVSYTFALPQTKPFKQTGNTSYYKF